MPESPLARLICLVGPTASGKSAAALALGARYPIEIVSVDSAQVYRGMDIGTAKPTDADRRAVPHHLIDILDPAEPYSAARFANDARAAIAAIRARGRIPLLVGGTMLYLKALREGLNDVPNADPRVRARLDRRALESGWPALHAELMAVDPVTAQRLAPTDRQRIQRALEVYEVSGRPLSAFLAVPRPEPTELDEIALEPSVRSLLHDRIEARLDHMFEAGLVDEVRALRRRGDLNPDLPSMRAVGYRQIWEYLEGRTSGLEMRGKAIAATRQLAKRQLTWLRARPARHVIDCLASDYVAQVEHQVARLLG